MSTTKPSIFGTPGAKPAPEREHLGYLENYYGGPNFINFLGTVSVQHSEQPCGSEHSRVITLTEDLIVSKSSQNTRKIKAGEVVQRIVFPLQGRALAT